MHTTACNLQDETARGAGKPGASVNRPRLRLQWILLCAGSLGLVYCLVSGASMWYAQRAASTIVPLSAVEADAAAFAPAFVSIAGGASDPSRPAVIGRVEVPAVGLVTALLAGDDSMSLLMGAGHIPGTALPGGLGTVGIAAHRDTHFRLLGRVTPGMEIRLVSQAGVYHYRATSSEIVSPEQVSVLDTGDVPSLALVTCYPFRFIGRAPKRFVVHARLISAAADMETDAAPR